jgi:hypothetical protein
MAIPGSAASSDRWDNFSLALTDDTQAARTDNVIGFL